MKRNITIYSIYRNNTQLTSLLNDIVLESSFEEKIYANRRNTLWTCYLEGIGKVVIKMFRYDSIRQLRYGLTDKSKARQAYENAIMLMDNGISTPAPVGYVDVEEGRGILFSALVTLYTPDEDISSIIDDDKDCAIAFAKMVATMHSAGLIHHDMNSSNVLYNKQDGNYNLSVIDLNRMKKKVTLSFEDEMDDLVRFTGRLDSFINVIYPYAMFMKHDIEPFVRKATLYKIKHDANWTRRKKLKRFFKSGAVNPQC